MRLGSLFDFSYVDPAEIFLIKGRLKNIDREHVGHLKISDRKMIEFEIFVMRLVGGVVNF